MKKNEKFSNIKIRVNLDHKKHPKAIFWRSDDNPYSNTEQEAKAILLSIFDKKYKDTYKLDLWTTDMEVVEMDRFVFQSLKAIADTYMKATGNRSLANDMQKFIHYFGEATEIISREK